MILVWIKNKNNRPKNKNLIFNVFTYAYFIKHKKNLNTHFWHYTKTLKSKNYFKFINPKLPQFLGVTVVWIQDFAHAKQVLYHFSQISSPQHLHSNIQ
jgi:hypothetical protein